MFPPIFRQINSSIFQISTTTTTYNAIILNLPFLQINAKHKKKKLIKLKIVGRKISKKSSIKFLQFAALNHHN